MKRVFSSSLIHFVAGMTIAMALFSPKVARADFIVTMTQVGSNVIATGSGAIDLSGLTFAVLAPEGESIYPAGAAVAVGPIIPLFDIYVGTFSGPRNFGTGGGGVPNSGSGDAVSIVVGLGTLAVAPGYISNSPLSDSSTYDNATFSSLGATPGTYEWTWGSGANQKFVLDIVSVPEPSSFVPIAVILLSWLGLRITRRRTAH